MYKNFLEGKNPTRQPIKLAAPGNSAGQRTMFMLCHRPHSNGDTHSIHIYNYAFTNCRDSSVNHRVPFLDVSFSTDWLRYVNQRRATAWRCNPTGSHPARGLCLGR